MARNPWSRLIALFSLGTGLLTGCFPTQAPPPPPAQFAVAPGDVYGPMLAPPISIRLGQSVVTAHGPIGPTDRPQGLAAFWEGHALSLDPDQDKSRSLFFYVEGDDLARVTLQINDQPPILEPNPGVYLSGEFSMVRWAQDYSLKVTAENARGVSRTAAIRVQGEDARLEGTSAESLRVHMLRQGDSVEREVRGVGYRGKLLRHYWPSCNDACDLRTPGGALIAMISGPVDTLLLLLDQEFPFVAWRLSLWPSPNYVLVAIPVRGESQVDLAVLSKDGEIATGRWDKPGGAESDLAQVAGEGLDG